MRVRTGTMNTIRTFIALDIGDDIRRGLAEAQKRLKTIGARVSWVAPDKMHLTLLFLGDTLEEQVPRLSAILDGETGKSPPFTLNVAGAGWFGSERSPRVLWAGIPDPPEPLMTLQQRIREEVSRLEYPLEIRPFTPHLTLGRVRGRRNATALTSALSSYKNSAFGQVTIDRLILFKSVLEPQGSRYEVLHESILKGE